jgi:hypothetical protein
VVRARYENVNFRVLGRRGPKVPFIECSTSASISEDANHTITGTTPGVICVHL